jgi:hypothetical protein
MRLCSNLKNSGLQKPGQGKKEPPWLNCQKRFIKWTLSQTTATTPVAATQATETKRVEIEELYLMSTMKGMLHTQTDLNTEAMTTIPPHPHRKTTCPIHSVFSCQISNSQKVCKRQTSEIWTALSSCNWHLKINISWISDLIKFTSGGSLEAKQSNQKDPRFEWDSARKWKKCLTPQLNSVD